MAFNYQPSQESILELFCHPTKKPCALSYWLMCRHGPKPYGPCAVVGEGGWIMEVWCWVQVCGCGLKVCDYLISAPVGLAWFWVWMKERPSLGVGGSSLRLAAWMESKGQGRLLPAAFCLPHHELFLLRVAPLPCNPALEPPDHGLKPLHTTR